MKRKSVIFIFLILSCFLLLACAKKEEVTLEKEESTPEEVAEKDYEEYTELWKMNQNSEVQFEDIPKETEGYTAKYYRFYTKEKIAEVVYVKEGTDDTVVLRKAVYEQPDGERNSLVPKGQKYEEHSVIDGVDFAYYRSGNKGLCNVAEWDDGKHFYALIINPGTDRGFEDIVIVKLIKSIR